LSWATIAAMLGVLAAMVVKPTLRPEFYASLACVAVVAIAWWLRSRLAASAPR
jgi:L-asparagine transporter-like permease